MSNIAYVRVSSSGQNVARQIEELKKYNIDKMFVDKISGKDTERTEFKKMMDYIREGDVIYVHDFSRFARSLKDLLELIDYFEENGIKLISTKENFDMSSPTGKLMIQMIGAINEFERSLILERQREGISIAKREGRYKGRKRTSIDEKQFNELKEKYDKRLITKVQFAKELGISRPTLDKLMKEKGYGDSYE